MRIKLKPKHLFQTFGIFGSYTKPLSLNKIKSNLSVKKLKELKINFKIYYKPIPSGILLEHEGVADSHMMIFFPKQEMNLQIRHIQELVKVDDIFERCQQLMNNEPFNPYIVPKQFVINLSEIELTQSLTEI